MASLYRVTRGSVDCVLNTNLLSKAANSQVPPVMKDLTQYTPHVIIQQINNFHSGNKVKFDYKKSSRQSVNQIGCLFNEKIRVYQGLKLSEL